MSCILSIWGENFDVNAFIEKTQMPEFEKYYKGEPIGGISRRKANFSRAFIATSEADFYDFKGQVEDTIQFLTEYKDNLAIIPHTPGIEHAVIDFGINSAISKEKLTQTFYFNKDLISICAELNIDIELSIYKEDMELILERRYKEKQKRKP